MFPARNTFPHPIPARAMLAVRCDRFRPNALCSGTTATAAGLLAHELLHEHTIPVLIHLPVYDSAHFAGNRTL